MDAISDAEFKALNDLPQPERARLMTLPADERRRLLQQAAAEVAAAPPAPSRVDLSDLRPAFTIAGRPCRPLSAGVLRLLEAIDHPLMRQAPGVAAALTLRDLLVLLYVLTEPELDTLLDLAELGPAALTRAADRWAFTLDPAALADAQHTAEGWIAGAATDLGEGSQEARPPTGSPATSTRSAPNTAASPASA